MRRIPEILATAVVAGSAVAGCTSPSHEPEPSQQSTTTSTAYELSGRTCRNLVELEDELTWRGSSPIVLNGQTGTVLSAGNEISDVERSMGEIVPNTEAYQAVLAAIATSKVVDADVQRVIEDGGYDYEKMNAQGEKLKPELRQAVKATNKALSYCPPRFSN